MTTDQCPGCKERLEKYFNVDGGPEQVYTLYKNKVSRQQMITEQKELDELLGAGLVSRQLKIDGDNYTLIFPKGYDLLGVPRVPNESAWDRW